MFITRELIVDAAFGAAQARLVRVLDAGGLTGPSQVAYAGGLTRLIRVGPFGDTPGVSKLVQVCSLSPVQHGRTMAVPLRWEATGPVGGLFPVLDADLILAADGEDRTRVALAGCYRPPMGRLGADLDRAVLRRVATATIRTLLRSVADAVATPAVEGHPRNGHAARAA